jgi:hypothetical protein
MRLINVKTRDLEEHYGPDIPRYAILSHRWEAQEVSFDDWQNSRDEIKHKKGFLKIIHACEQAERDNLEYLWCDTNCIDKTSSAELSEAINSMFSWYNDSQVCYAYLSDVPQLFRSDLDELQSYGQDPSQDLKDINGAGASAFLRSKWFTRGWTLQELLAPCKVQFYSQEWTYIADRAWLAESISRTAHIDCSALTDDSKPLKNYSIAVRMSWASARITTVLEDEAYCLLGIFDVQMPLLYGEGAKAFQRLQKEIVQQGLADQSLLAWWETPQNLDPQKTFFLPALAPSAAAFAKSGTVERAGSPKMSWTSEGLSTDVYMLGTLKPDLFFALLSCRESNSMGWTAQEESIWIPLLRRGKSNNFGRVLYASNRLILPWREASRAPNKDEGFLFKEITIENAPHQDENHSFYERGCYMRNPPSGTATFIVLVHDRRYSEPDELKQEWWQMNLDQKHWFKEDLDFSCPSNATVTQTYLGARCYHGGLERQIGLQEAKRMAIPSRSINFAVRVSIASDINGKPSQITGTTVSPLQELIRDTEDIQWPSSNQDGPSSGLKTVESQSDPDNSYRSYTTRLESRKPKYSAFKSSKFWISSLHFEDVLDEPYKEGGLSVFVGTNKSLMESKSFVASGEPREGSGWCIPLILQWADNL